MWARLTVASRRASCPPETAAVYAAPGYLLLVSQGVLAAYPFDVTGATVTGEPIAVAQAVGTDDGSLHSAFSVSGQGVLAHRAGGGFRRQLVWVDRDGQDGGGDRARWTRMRRSILSLRRTANG